MVGGMRLREHGKQGKCGAGTLPAMRSPVFASVRAAAIFLAILLACAQTPGAPGPKGKPATRENKSSQGPAPAPREYVGSAACSRCHLAIASQFAKASMGRSLTRITPEFLKTLPLPA